MAVWEDVVGPRDVLSVVTLLDSVPEATDVVRLAEVGTFFDVALCCIDLDVTETRDDAVCPVAPEADDLIMVALGLGFE